MPAIFPLWCMHVYFYILMCVCECSCKVKCTLALERKISICFRHDFHLLFKDWFLWKIPSLLTHCEITPKGLWVLQKQKKNKNTIRPMLARNSISYLLVTTAIQDFNLKMQKKSSRFSGKKTNKQCKSLGDTGLQPVDWLNPKWAEVRAGIWHLAVA